MCKHLQGIGTVNTSKLGINLVTIIEVKVHFFLNVQGHIKYNEQKDVYSEPSAIQNTDQLWCVYVTNRLYEPRLFKWQINWKQMLYLRSKIVTENMQLNRGN